VYTKDGNSAGTYEIVTNWRIKRWRIRQIVL